MECSGVLLGATEALGPSGSATLMSHSTNTPIPDNLCKKDRTSRAVCVLEVAREVYYGGAIVNDLRHRKVQDFGLDVGSCL